MVKKSVLESEYNVIEKLVLVSQCILWISVLISSCILLISKTDLVLKNITVPDILSRINCFLAITYFALDIVESYFFQHVESKRRDDFFDNSFNTKLSAINSQEYFSNNDVDYGIKKMAVNNFENSLFTKTISSKMLRRLIVKSAIFLLLFLAIALFTDGGTLSVVLQMALPFTILLQTIRLFVYNRRVNEVFKTYQTIFSSTFNEEKVPLVIRNMTNYETTLSWACIKLDNKWFPKLHDELSRQWIDLKKKYHISS